MVRTLGWIAGGILLGLVAGPILGIAAIQFYRDWTGYRGHGDFEGLDFLIGGFCGAALGCVMGAILGAVLDAKHEKRAKQ